MLYLTICLLLTTAMSFSNPSLAKPNTTKKRPSPFTLYATFPPITSYLALKSLNKYSPKFDFAAEKM